MCLNPISIRNKSKYRSLNSAELNFYTVPCGKCAECRKAKANEYTARSYAQYIATEKSLGFSYFETLTYAPDYLPTIYGLPCFDTAHYRNFFKRLRKNIDSYILKDNNGNYILDSNGNKQYPFKGLVAKNLKYFFASEYGGKTHRPHYHVIFFVTIPGMDLIQFRNFVNDAWHYGFIDRIQTVRSRKINGIGAMHYVSEYVNKDYEFMKMLNAKIKQLESKGIYLSDEELKRLQPFHRQSQGFGIDIINQNDYDYMFQTGMIRIPDKKKVWRTLPIPMYIKRKLFYDKVQEETQEYKPKYKRDARGKKTFVGYDYQPSYKWVLNDRGKAFKLNRINDTITLLANRYEVYVNNMDSSMQGVPVEKIDALKNTITNYLEKYSYYDLAVYNSYYKNRLFTQDMDMYEIALADAERPTSYRPYYVTEGYITRKEYLPKNSKTYKPVITFDFNGIQPSAHSVINYAIAHPTIIERDSNGEYILDRIGLANDADLLGYHHIELDLFTKCIEQIMRFRNKALNKTYFAQVEYRAKMKALKSA